MEKRTYYRTRLRAKGQVTLPPVIRRRLGVSEGEDVAFYMNDQGQVVLSSLRLIPPDQAWFWTERWQKMEMEVEQDMADGRTRDFANVEEAIRWLHEESTAFPEHNAENQTESSVH